MELSQLHLEALHQTKLIDELWDILQVNELDELDSSVISTERENICLAIRFFGKNFANLQESNGAMLKLARIFLSVSSKKLIEWTIRDSNAFLLLITTMLLKQKDELLIRQITVILKEFVMQLPKTQLESLVKLHQKPVRLIFRKMNKVMTYYTQMKLLDVLITFLKLLDDGGAKLISEAFVDSNRETIQDVLHYFDSVDSKDFLHTSREFLDCYNKDVVKSPFIYSLSGFLTGFNGQKSLVFESIVVDFNLLNLSISFFVNANASTQSIKVFVELEDCVVDAQKGKFQNANHIELKIKPSRFQILDERDERVLDYNNIESVLLVICDDQNLLMSMIVPHFYEKKTKLAVDVADLEPVVSLPTAENSFDNCITSRPSSKPTVVSKPDDQPSIKPVEVQQLSPDLFSAEENLVPIQAGANESQEKLVDNMTDLESIDSFQNVTTWIADCAKYPQSLTVVNKTDEQPLEGQQFSSNLFATEKVCVPNQADAKQTQDKQWMEKFDREQEKKLQFAKIEPIAQQVNHSRIQNVTQSVPTRKVPPVKEDVVPKQIPASKTQEKPMFVDDITDLEPVVSLPTAKTSIANCVTSRPSQKQTVVRKPIKPSVKPVEVQQLSPDLFSAEEYLVPIQAGANESQGKLVDNMTDLESIDSFQNVTTWIANCAKYPSQKQIVVNQTEKKPIKVQQLSSNLFEAKNVFVPRQAADDETKDKQWMAMFKGEPEKKLQVAKIEPLTPQAQVANQSRIQNFLQSVPTRKVTPKRSDYDDIPSDDSLPPLSRFMAQQRNARLKRFNQQRTELTLSVKVQSNRDVEWTTVAKTTAKKPSVKKRSPRYKKKAAPTRKDPPKPRGRTKKVDYSTDSGSNERADENSHKKTMKEEVVPLNRRQLPSRVKPEPMQVDEPVMPTRQSFVETFSAYRDQFRLK